MKYDHYNRMSSQKAKNDSSLEALLGKFTFDHFWSKLGATERVTCKELQIRGVDVQVGTWNVDEKVKYYESKTKGFMQDLLQYPSFELSFVNQAGQVQTGWFLDPKSLTTHYAFVQPFSKQPNPRLFKMEDLIKVNILLVKKDEMDWAKHRGVYDDSLKLRDDYKFTGERRLRYPQEPFWLTYSDFNEKPVNLVVPRFILKSLPSTREFEIDNNGKIVELKER